MKYEPLGHLRVLRFGWKDEIPQVILHSTDKDNWYKVRARWFTGVCADTFNLLNEKRLQGPQSIAAAQQLIQVFTSEEFVSKERTDQGDIVLANQLIDAILADGKN